MKYFFTLALIAFFSTMALAQESPFILSTDPKHPDQQMMVGAVSFTDIIDSKTSPWFKKGYDSYTADSNRIKDLTKVAGKYRFVVFVGTWCEDTQYLLPKFAKVMNACRVSDKQIEMYAVDRNKQALNVETILYKIEKVPTIIVTNGAREIGRVVESLTQSNIETELIYLIEKDIESQQD
jgi:thiol-disulfide isomerase/thioredoxin